MKDFRRRNFPRLTVNSYFLQSCPLKNTDCAANGRGTKFREPTGTAHDLGDSAGALELDESSSRH